MPAGPTGPASRKTTGKTAYDQAVSGAESAEGTRDGITEGKGKGKQKENVGKTVAVGFQTYRAAVEEHDAKLAERSAKRQKLEEDKLALEKERAEREEAKHKLDMQIARRQAAEQDRKSYISQVESFLHLYEIDMGFELSGELAFAEKWLEAKPKMEKVIADRAAQASAATMPK